MFFIGIFGGGVKQKAMGSTSQRNCPRCHNTTPWIVYDTTKYFSLFFIPVARWGKRYFISCPICGETIALDSRDEARGFIDHDYSQTER